MLIKALKRSVARRPKHNREFTSGGIFPEANGVKSDVPRHAAWTVSRFRRSSLRLSASGVEI